MNLGFLKKDNDKQLCIAENNRLYFFKKREEEENQKKRWFEVMEIDIKIIDVWRGCKWSKKMKGENKSRQTK